MFKVGLTVSKFGMQENLKRTKKAIQQIITLDSKQTVIHVILIDKRLSV